VTIIDVYASISRERKPEYKLTDAAMLVREHAADGAGIDAGVRESAGADRTDRDPDDDSTGACEGGRGYAGATGRNTGDG